MVVFRSISHSDVDSVASVEAWEPVGFIDSDRFRAEYAERQYRDEWTWIAEREGRIVARALWWGRPDSALPISLDCLWADTNEDDPAGRCAGLISTALAQLHADGLVQVPDYNLDLAPDWTDDAAAVAAVGWRLDAVRAAGMDRENERIQFEWRADQPVPARHDAVRFIEAEDEEFAAIFERVAVGSLDVLTRHSLESMGPEGQARDDLEFYSGLPGERSWWRIATTTDGTVIGCSIPSRSAYEASVSYLGVVPEQRGNRYVDALLAEITRVHADHGAPRITGMTDVTNVPMAAAFRRAGYSVVRHRVVVSA